MPRGAIRILKKARCVAVVTAKVNHRSSTAEIDKSVHPSDGTVGSISKRVMRTQRVMQSGCGLEHEMTLGKRLNHPDRHLRRREGFGDQASHAELNARSGCADCV